MTDSRKPTTAVGRHRSDRTTRSALLVGSATVGRRIWLRCWALITVGSVTVASSFAVSWLDWLAYWPGLAFALSRVAAAVRTVARAVVRTARRAGPWRGWPAVARHARTVGRFVHRWAPVIAEHPWRAAWWLTVHAGRVIRWAARRFWRWAEPYVRDAAGWLVHTAPRRLAHWSGRMLLRLARWAPGALLRLLGWSAIGIGWLVARLVMYCATYPEYAGMIREAKELDKPRRVHALQTTWRRTAARRCGFFLALGLLGWWGWSVAVEAYGTRARLVIITAVMIMTAIVGRVVKPPAERDPAAPDDPAEEENAPYPIADAHTRAEAADCVARALAAENIALRMAGEAQRTRWGWTVPVILRTGTPAAIVAKTGELETHLDLPAGGVLATPDRSRRARVVLRLAQTDPFVGLGYAPSRPPASCSITQRAVIGRRIDGADLAVPLLGVHGVVIGSPGSGKSTSLLALGDVISACTDAVLWDLDPAGDGLRALGAGVGRRDRDPAGIEDALADALALAEVRPRMLTDLGMGAAWQPSRERPAVVVIVDEYPRLTARAKQLAVQLLRVGRKARVTLILAATEATSDALGAAIADTTALKIMHACRFQDIQLVLGPQMGAEGWRPDRLHPATADDPGDAGCCYVATAGHREPLLSKVAPVDVDRLVEQGRQVAAFGRPRIDADSWDRARARRSATREESSGRGEHTAIGGGIPEPRQRAAVDHQGITDVIAAFDADRRLWTEELLSRLTEADGRYAGWSAEDLAALVRPLGVRPVQVWREGRNRNGYDRDALIAAFRAWQSGGDH